MVTCTYVFLRLDTASTEIDLARGRLDAAEGDGLAVGQLVHGVEGDVEAAAGVVDGEHVDGLAVVG